MAPTSKKSKAEEAFSPFKKIRDSFLNYLGIVAGLIVLGGVTFYFNTINDQQATRSEISALKLAHNELLVKIEQKASKDDLNQFKDAVKGDIEMIHQDIREVRDDNKKILELLSAKSR